MISAVDGERGITWSANRSRCRRGQALRFEKFATELDRVGLALSPIDLNEHIGSLGARVLVSPSVRTRVDNVFLFRSVNRIRQGVCRSNQSEQTRAASYSGSSDADFLLGFRLP
jgi:hypothetical protein